MPYHILHFSRIKSISVDELSDHLLKSDCYLRDNLKEIRCTIYVERPELNIIDARCEIRSGNSKEIIPKEEFDQLIGSRIGPGIFKIIKNTVGDNFQIAFSLEECCRAVILSFTKEDLLTSPRPDDDEEAIRYYANMVRENVRLYGRCAAFSEGSRIIEEVEKMKDA